MVGVLAINFTSFGHCPALGTKIPLSEGVWVAFRLKEKIKNDTNIEKCRILLQFIRAPYKENIMSS